jgi:tetratricopeptide (TPR) repeat protein
VPPFTTDQGQEDLAQAARGDLAGAFVRLEQCRADPPLVQLARQCLAAAKEDRPPNAGAVAAAVATYQAQLQARLRAAEIERAAALTRAREEHKRRRLQAGLAAALLLFALALGGGATWYWSARAAQQTRQAYMRREVADTLSRAAGARDDLQATLADPLRVQGLLSNLDRWQGNVRQARADWQRARLLADSDQDLIEPDTLAALEQLDQQLRVDEQDVALAVKLDAVRLQSLTMAAGHFDPASAAPRLERLFRDAGLEIRTGQPAVLASRIGGSSLRFAWVAALDHWAQVIRKKGNAAGDGVPVARLLEVARRADPDPWRDQARDPQASPETCRRLARNVVIARQAPAVLTLLAFKLPRAEAQALLRRALVEYPQDISLYLHLGALSQTPPEREVCYRAALAVRPDSSVALNNLGTALQMNRDYEDAITYYRLALRANPSYAAAQANWGHALHDQGDLEGAVAHYRQALQLDPADARTHHNWGNALFEKKDTDAALDHYQQALRLDTGLAWSHINVGRILFARRDYDRALRAFREAHRLTGGDAGGWLYRALATMVARDGTQMGPALRRVLADAPDFAEARLALGLVWLAEGKFADAAAEFRRAQRTFPKDHPAQAALSLQLQHCQQLQALDERLAAVLQGEATSSAEQLAAAELCMNIRNRPMDALRLYTAVFAADRQLIGGKKFGPCYSAARCAILVGCGHDPEAKALTAEARAKWRQQALAWLEENLRYLTAAVQVATGPRDVKGGNHTLLARVLDDLADWQKTDSLALVREATQLVAWPAAEQEGWRRLWANVRRLEQQARAAFTETHHSGRLTIAQREQVHPLALRQGQAYVVDLDTDGFEAGLRLEDGQGRILVVGKHLARDRPQQSRILFTAPANGASRLIAGGVGPVGWGRYTLTVREFHGGQR